MKKLMMLILTAGITGSAYAAIWDVHYGVNSEDGGYTETQMDTLSAPSAVGSSDSGSGLFESMLNSDKESFDSLEDGS